jgi:integrase
LQAYVTARTNDGVTAATIRRELVPIVSALRSGYKYFEDLEGYTPPRIPRPKVEKAQKERVISKTEQDGLFAYFFAGRQEGEALRTFEGRYRTGQFLMFCLLTLSRPGEIAALKKDDIDLTAGVVSIHGTKTRFRSTQLTRRLSITPTMRRIIEERLNVARGEFLFTSGGSVTPTMYEQLKAACESIGVRYGRTDKQAISFHTARHTGITMLLQNNVDLKTVGRMAGQSDSRMTLYYTHSNPELVSRASAILEQKMGREIAVHRSDG